MVNTVYAYFTAPITELLTNLDQQLIDATIKQDITLVQIALDAGANVDHQDERGNTALIFASLRNNVDIVQILLDAGADPDLRALGDSVIIGSLVGMNALTATSSLEVIKLLLKYGADINSKGRHDCSPLMLYALDTIKVDNKQEIIKFLIDHGADINTTDSMGRNIGALQKMLDTCSFISDGSHNEIITEASLLGNSEESTD
jgi:ankyrin repeat protein